MTLAPSAVQLDPGDHLMDGLTDLILRFVMHPVVATVLAVLVLLLFAGLFVLTRTDSDLDDDHL